MRHRRNDNNWVSFTDLMTGLMVVFMFVAVSFILEIVSDTFAQKEIYNTLNKEMANNLEDWGAQLSENLSVRFTPEKGRNYFDDSSYRIKSGFKKTLDEFFPPYLEIITDTAYIDYISEIRIEGHTNSHPNWKDQKRLGMDTYGYNLRLSSKRAQEVLKYLKTKYIDKIPDERIKNRLEFLLTANGLSYTQRLNKDGELVYLSDNKEEDMARSKRVEFRIMTSNETLIQKLLKKESE